MTDYLEVNSDGLAVGGVYQKISGTDPDEWINWVEITNGAQLGWTHANGVWVEPEAPKVPIDEVRAERNKLLSTSDFTQLPDTPLSLEEKEAWATYRQKLRDLPNNYEPSEKVDWPVL
jgi:hypothetical protein